MAKDRNSLGFVSTLFELAIGPFQAYSQRQAAHFQYEPHAVVLLLFPAFLVFIPVCLLISAVAMGYVFLVLPFILAYQGIAALLGSAHDK